ncbi:hypothetical protein AVEN_151145-1 [Araneus ventricosus]|uniref:Uncharacterized protein n=1 Tax=Araneus ventricosus TaxID=182803 RepID=A0A4Y2F1L6_ARAVE|nr:hypothetical protein AVEN_151145-1 [Araneus ventricosus]
MSAVMASNLRNCDRNIYLSGSKYYQINGSKLPSNRDPVTNRKLLSVSPGYCVDSNLNPSVEMIPFVTPGHFYRITLKSIYQILSQIPDVLSKRVYNDEYPPDTFPKTEVDVPNDHQSFAQNSQQMLVPLSPLTSR